MRALALHSPLLRPLPRLRVAAAALVLAAALSGAAVLYGHRAVHPCPPVLGFCPRGTTYRPSWVQPAALAVLLIGVAGAGVLVTRRRSDR